MNTHEQYLFLQTLGHLFDGTAADVDKSQFTQRVAEDAEAQAIFMKFVAFDLELEWFSGRRPRQDFFTAGSVTTFAPEQSPSTNPLDANTASSLPTLSARKSWLASPSLLSYAALVALCFYGSFVLIAWNLRPDWLASSADDQDQCVATVKDATDAKWSPKMSLKSKDSSIRVGEPLKIESGTMELELAAGTKLVVEGPADWSISNSNSVSLRIGKLFARVPEQAIGFTVETATAKIVDLGTEFAVEADKQGSTEVQVFKGKVELRPGTKANDSSHAKPSITLTAGEARRIEVDDKNGVNITKVTPTPDRFTRHRSLDPTSSRQIRIEGAYASSTCKDPQFDVRYLIDGHGLKDGRHAADPRNSMWRSRLGDVKNVFVSFDLGGARRVESMKVWNFNVAKRDEYRFRGVKQADIYASNSGKGDPLSQPNEWKLVAADQQFAPGDGTPNYSSPTSISLGDIETRFVAIVIDEALGINPNLTRPYGATEKVNFGRLSAITDVSSLDLSGTFSYALELGYTRRGHTVSSITFTDPKSTPGVKLNMGEASSGGVSTPFGADADNQALRAILSRSLFTNLASLTGSIELAVSPGKTYKLQLLYNETYPDTTRIQNLAINGSVAVSGLVQMTGVPRVYTHQFVSSGNAVTIDFSAGAGPNSGNDIWTHIEGLTLELMSDDEHASKTTQPKSENQGNPPDCIGLSEVQFFGSRVDSSNAQPNR